MLSLKKETVMCMQPQKLVFDTLTVVSRKRCKVGSVAAASGPPGARSCYGTQRSAALGVLRPGVSQPTTNKYRAETIRSPPSKSAPCVFGEFLENQTPPSKSQIERRRRNFWILHCISRQNVPKIKLFRNVTRPPKFAGFSENKTPPLEIQISRKKKRNAPPKLVAGGGLKGGLLIVSAGSLISDFEPLKEGSFRT